MASGVLPLVVGRATRLARFMGERQDVRRLVRLGVGTDSYDAHGKADGGPCRTVPSAERLESALDAFRGTFAAAAAGVFGQEDRRTSRYATRSPAGTPVARRTR